MFKIKIVIPVRVIEAIATVSHSQRFPHKRKPSIAQKFTGTKHKVTACKVWAVNCKLLCLPAQKLTNQKIKV